MKHWTLAALAAIATVCAAHAAEQPKLESHEQKVGYLIGHNIGSGFHQDEVELDFDALIAGLKAGMAGTPLQLTREQAMEVQQAFRARMEAKAEAKSAKLAEAGRKFLESNKKRPEVKTTASGLQYEVLKKGSGKTPTKDDQVTTHYTGTLVDGTKFDSSVDRGQPATFPVGGVIKGWTEALQLMKEGDKWKLYIPHELAYGAQGSPPAIPPAAALIFEIELIKVN